MPARILVIEDNPANLQLMIYLLRAYKYEPLSAEDGEQGLALAQSERPDVVVCDIQLPHMDGYEVVRRLKTDTATRSIPVIAVTAFAMVGDRDRALAAGFDGYIGKPIAPETFVSQVEQFIKPVTPARAVTQQESGEATTIKRATHAGARILVVDNTAANRLLLVSTLAPVGYEVITASNVTSALNSARTMTPDLIISDLHMPGADGFELLARIRADATLRHVSFVFASVTILDEQERHRALAAGADLFLLRPGDPQSVLREVDALLARKGGAHGDDTGR